LEGTSTSPLAVDARLQRGPWNQAEGIAQWPGNGELTLGGEGLEAQINVLS
jgi:hypothetical protein